MDPYVNFSDHLPLLATVALSVTVTDGCSQHGQANIQYPRWDKADTRGYL